MQSFNLDSAQTKVNLINTIAGVGVNAKDAGIQYTVWLSEIEESIEAIENGQIVGDDGLVDGLADSMFVAFSYAFATGVTLSGTMYPVALEMDSECALVKLHELTTCASYNDPYMKEFIQTKMQRILDIADNSSINLEMAFNEVCRANLTKFDRCELDALVSQQKYDEKGVTTVTRESNVDGQKYYVQIVEESVTVDGKHYPAGKWMKSHLWNAPVITSDFLL